MVIYMVNIEKSGGFPMKNGDLYGKHTKKRWKMMKNVASFSDLMGFNGDFMEIPSGKLSHNYGITMENHHAING